MNEFDREWLKDMLEYASKAVRVLGPANVESLAVDETKLLAVSYAIQVVGEAASRVSPEARKEFPMVPWGDVVGMRHRLVHGYRARSPQVIAETVRAHLPPLIAMLEQALGDEDS